jgi:flagellar biosynthesis protein
VASKPNPPPHPPKTAVALRYETGRDEAPRVVATGRGTVAEVIVRRAQETGVAIREDEALTAALAGLDLGDTIPPELYRAVAEVLAYIYRLDATP